MIIEVTYEELLTAEPWVEKRKQILFRDGNKCRNCGSKYNLQVHHKQYHVIKETNTKREPWDYDNKHLITLCNSCHKQGHSLYKIPFFNL